MEYGKEELRRLQLAELKILKEVAALCDRNNLTWFLEGGSALGAVRHGGFIPWDDDIDAGMPRADYDKFLEIAREGLPDWLRLDNPENKTSMACTFSKVCWVGTVFETEETKAAGYDQGIFIDIFPYDKVSSNRKTRRKQLRIASEAVRLKYLYFSPRVSVPHDGLLGSAEKLFCALAHMLLKRFSSAKAINMKFQKSVFMVSNTDAPFCDGDLVTTLSFPYINPLKFEDLVPCKMVEFEGNAFPVPRDVNRYLSNLYGDDWSVIPPKEKQKNHAPTTLAFSEVVD